MFQSCAPAGLCTKSLHFWIRFADNNYVQMFIIIQNKSSGDQTVTQMTFIYVNYFRFLLLRVKGRVCKCNPIYSAQQLTEGSKNSGHRPGPAAHAPIPGARPLDVSVCGCRCLIAPGQSERCRSAAPSLPLSKRRRRQEACSATSTITM